MKYPELKGVCKNCLGCNKLENPYFTGENECEYFLQPKQDNEQISEKGEQLKI
jgi:hypothetical protein